MGQQISISYLPFCIHLNKKINLLNFSSDNLSLLRNIVLDQKVVLTSFRNILISDLEHIPKFYDHQGNISYSYADLITLCNKSIPTNLYINNFK